MLHARTSAAIILALLFCRQAPTFANNGPTEPDCECPKVTGITASSTVTSATISWVTSPIYSSYLVQILKGNGSNTKVYFQTSTTAGSVVINGTSPSTLYIARVYGVCGDGQSVPNSITFNTVAGTPACGSGSADIGGDRLHPVPISPLGEAFYDQIDFEGDDDAYLFDVPCPGVVTITLSSLSNDYDIIAASSTGIYQMSSLPGTTNEVITFTVSEAMKVVVYITGFQTAYNTYDCYTISVVAPLPCFGGGGGENLVSGNGTGTNPSPVITDGNLQVNLDSAMEKDEQVDVQVFAADGRMVLNESTQVLKGENQVHLDMPSVSDGVYILHVSGAFGMKSQKIVVAR